MQSIVPPIPMSRFFSILAASLILGAMVALLLPQWQGHILSPGDVKRIEIWEQGLEITTGVPGQSNEYWITSRERAQELVSTAAFATDPGVTAHGMECEVTPREIVWETKSGKKTTTHRAPGMEIRLRAEIKIGEDVGEVAEVRWGGPAFQKLVESGNMVVRRGPVILRGKELVLGRYQVARPGLDRSLAIICGAFLGGAPLSLPFLLVGLLTLGFPGGRQPVRETPLRMPAEFAPRYLGCRINLAIWGMLTTLVFCILGVCMLVSDRLLVDLSSALTWNIWMGVIGIAVVAFILWCTLLSLRAVRLDESHIEVRAGASGKVVLNLPWNQLQSAQGKERLHRGKVAVQWLELRDPAGKKVKIHQNYVQEYALLKETVMKLAPA